MDVFIPKEIQEGLDAARRANQRKASRLRIDENGQLFAVLRMWKDGFAIALEDAPKLRGLVDVFDGAAHQFQCLIVASTEQHGEMHYDFKRAAPVVGRAALDIDKVAQAPAGQLVTNDF